MESRDQNRGQDPPLRGIINTIARSFASGGSLATSRKKHLRVVKSVTNILNKPLRFVPNITFTNEDFQTIDPDQDDSMVITVDISDYVVMETLIDQGSSVDILYWKTYKHLGFSDDLLKQYHDQIVGFFGERVDVKGYVELKTRFIGKEESKAIGIHYLIVEADTSYNVLLGRPY